MQVLFDYQQHANDVLIPETLRSGKKRICLSAPCGSGKTTQIADLCRRAASKGRTVTVTAHRRKLIKQLSERLKSFGIRYTVEMADLPDEPWVSQDSGAEVVIGSMQTMLSRIDDSGVRQTNIVIPDEGHTIASNGYRKLLGSINAEYMVAPTATPCNSDGSGFGPKIFDALIQVTTIEELIAREQPRLVPVDVFAPIGVGKKRRKGLKAGVSGDPVKQWIDHACGLRTIVFCRTLAECRTVVDMYKADTISAVHVDARSSDEERDQAIADLEAGEIKVIVCTPSLMGVGVDIPFLECVQLLVKNHSPVVQWQTVGRVQRIVEGKTRAVLLDHAAAVYSHGMPNTSPVWTLSDKDSVQRLTSERQSKDPTMKPQVCPSCGCITAGSSVCPKCQTLLAIQRKSAVGTEREKLSGVDNIEGSSVNPDWQKQWRNFLYMGAARGMKCGAVSNMFRNKYGVWPNAAGVHPCPHMSDSQKPIGEVFPHLIRRKS